MQEKILAINAGSSSLKFQLFEMPDETVLVKGVFEEIGSGEGLFSYEGIGKKSRRDLMIKDHQHAVSLLVEMLIEQSIISSFSEIAGIGHRVAHGGEYFKRSSLIDEKSLEKIKELGSLAPIHNPINAIGIEAFMKVSPGILHVGVFDTAFHQSLRKEKYIYPVPYAYYEKYGIRKYGFHGTSHQYVAEQAMDLLAGLVPADVKIISCHLGNGASICAIQNGVSVNTSMGFTPLSGLMMGTRSGDIDPSIITFIQKAEGKSSEEIDQLLNRESGLLGVSGLSNDCRQLELAAREGNLQAKLALTMFVERIAQTIGSYAADLNGVAIIIFTAGIGENSAFIRKEVCKSLGFLGVALDPDKNDNSQTWIQQEAGSVRVGVIPTDEEVMIARDTYELVSK